MKTEQQIQTEIIKYASLNNWLVVNTIKLSISGMPDLFLFKNGTTIFIEVKNETGKQSELQKVRQRQLQKQGFICEVIRSIDQFKELICKM